MIEQKVSDDAVLITCILYRGGGEKVLEALLNKNVIMTSHIHARGSGIGDPVERNGIPRQFEKEVVSFIAPASQSDELLQFVFDAAEIDRPYGGFLFVERLQRNSSFALPDAPKA